MRFLPLFPLGDQPVDLALCVLFGERGGANVLGGFTNASAFFIAQLISEAVPCGLDGDCPAAMRQTPFGRENKRHRAAKGMKAAITQSHLAARLHAALRERPRLAYLHLAVERGDL